MIELLFLAGVTLLFGSLLTWGFTFLTGERWQMLAVVPTRKDRDNRWQGLNLTFYGFFVATSQLFAVTLLIILLGAHSISLAGTLLTIFLLLSVCLPAARIVAILVEKKRHTFTVGGASFIGILLAPLAIVCAAQLLEITGNRSYMPLLPTMAALSVCYLLGEGLGRLGCISYGCCYGKPLCQCSTRLRRIINNKGFTFTGATQKAVYEGRFAGEPLVPIQAITAIVYTVGALVSCGLFLYGNYRAALLFSIGVGQGWRVLSETLRADFRGYSTISAYQKMSMAAIVYVVLASMLIPAPAADTSPNLLNGFKMLWQPGLILGLQVLWLLFFSIFGKSSVTTATVSFDVIAERV